MTTISLRRGLLVCGVLSSLLYVGMDVLAGLRTEGYSFVSQAISELSAIGAPARPLILRLGIVYTGLVIAFGWGVRGSVGDGRALRVLGGLLIAYGVTNLAWPFAPMHPRGAEFTLTDAMHIVLSIVSVLLFLLILGFGSAALGRRFRLYSIGTLLVVVAFGALTGLAGPRIAAGLSTPRVGVYERAILYSFMFWIGVLAIALLRRSGSRGSRRHDEAGRDVGRRVDEPRTDDGLRPDPSPA